MNFVFRNTCSTIGKFLFVAMLILVTGCYEEPKNDTDASQSKPAASKNDSAKSDKSNAQNAEQSQSFYTVAHYDIQADPAAQLVDTLKRAKSENKTVLLQVGGDWCGWCKLMTEYIDDNDAVNKLISENFLIQKVTYEDKNKNEEFLSDYPEIKGYPHLYVLDADGKLLHSQHTDKLEEGRGYSEEAFVEFLNKWKPGG